MSGTADLPIASFASAEEWDAWLAREHATSAGVRLKLAKKGAGATALRHAQALEVALCYGWIDGQASKLDEQYWLVRFTPRRAKSMWSKVNRAKALELIAQGKMKPAGLREVERAQEDGRWEAAYDPQSRAQVPEDLQVALEANEPARDFFAMLDSRNRYAVLYRIQTAKKPETRRRRIEQFVAMLAEGKTIYP